MLTGSSFLSYQQAPLQSIRDAIKDEEHHIVRVNEEGTGEIYDLNLSRSAPYASPIVRTTAADGNAIPGSLVKARSEADGVNEKDGTLLGAEASPRTQTPSAGRRILHLPQIVSRRHAHASNNSTTGPMSAAAVPAMAEGNGTRLSNAVSPQTQTPNGSVIRQPITAGELPPSPPLEADMQQYMGSVDESVDNHASSSKRTPPKERDGLPHRVKPRRAATDDFPSLAPARRHVQREPSVMSNTTSYMTASSHDGSFEEETASSKTQTARTSAEAGSQTARFTDSPLTSEPSSALLHPSSALQDAAGSARRHVTPPSTISNASAVPVRQGMPARRNTTGMATIGTKRRTGSVSSTDTRASRHRSRERDINVASGISDDESGQPYPPAAAPLKTGDAGFDEAIAKKYDQIRRERETKKMREQQEGVHDGEGHQQEALMRGGTVLTRARSGRRGTEDEPKALIGNVIGEGHANYVLMYNMLTGIRIGVSRCQAKMKRPLTDADYMAKHKFTFDIIGNELTPSAKYDFKFKDYAPWVFRELREHFHLDAADYLLSLTAKYILSELGSPGKSGSFFYFSRDYRFIIKTIRHNEHKFLRRILKDYHLHIKENPHTLLSRFYGLHRVKLAGGKKIHFVIMNNLFPPHKDIHETYDLKGSAIGREYPEEKAAQKKGAVLKDLNWIKRGREMEFGPAKRALLEAQIRSDVALLQRLGIMDYSLLIGLHDMKRGNREGLRQDALQVVQPDAQTTTANGALSGQLRREPTTRMEKEAYALRAAVRRSDAKALGSTSTAKLPERETSDRHHFLFYQDEGGFRSTDEQDRPSDWIYYFGIIDTLTLYNSVKRSEHYWKSLTHNSKMISAIHPVAYGNRFCNFLFSVIKGADKSKRPRML